MSIDRSTLIGIAKAMMEGRRAECEMEPPKTSSHLPRFPSAGQRVQRLSLANINDFCLVSSGPSGAMRYVLAHLRPSSPGYPIAL